MSAHYKQPLDWNDKLWQDPVKYTIQKWYDGVDKNKYFSPQSIKKKLLEKTVKIPDEILKPFI